MRGNRGNTSQISLSIILFLTVIASATVASSAKESLRDLADKQGILLGAAAGTAFFGRDSTVFKTHLKQEFNALVAEYQMKFGQVQPTRGDFNWAGPDRMLAYA